MLKKKQNLSTIYSYKHFNYYYKNVELFLKFEN